MRRGESFGATVQFFLVGLLLCASACREWAQDRVFHGKYFEDSLFSQLEGLEGRVKNEEIKIEYSFVAQTKSATIQLSTREHRDFRRIEMRDVSSRGFKLKLWDREWMSFKKIGSSLSAGNCFEATSELDYRVCLGETDFILVAHPSGATGIPALSISGWEEDEASGFHPDPVREFKLSEVLDLVRKRNLNSKIAVEQLLQARYRMMATYFNLLPHLRIASAAGAYQEYHAALGPNPFHALALTNASNDLTPFIFPTRWIAAFRSKLFFWAQRDAFRIANAGLMNEAEVLAYEMLHLQASHQLSTGVIEQLESLEGKLRELEAAGRINPGSDLAVEQLRQRLLIFRDEQQSLATVNRAALSEVLGFENHESVKRLELDRDFFPVETAEPLDVQKTVSQFLERSVELKQIDFYIRAARNERVNLYFQWLDPSGSAQNGLGLNLIPQHKLVRSEVKVLEHKKKQIRLQLVRRGGALVKRSNLHIRQYLKAKALFEKQQARVKRVLDFVQSSPPLQLPAIQEFRGNEIEVIFQQYLDAALQMQLYRTGYRITRANIDRLRLEGVYSEFVGLSSADEAIWKPQLK